MALHALRRNTWRPRRQVMDWFKGTSGNVTIKIHQISGRIPVNFPIIQFCVPCWEGKIHRRPHTAYTAYSYWHSFCMILHGFLEIFHQPNDGVVVFPVTICRGEELCSRWGCGTAALRMDFEVNDGSKSFEQRTYWVVDWTILNTSTNFCAWCSALSMIWILLEVVWKEPKSPIHSCMDKLKLPIRKRGWL